MAQIGRSADGDRDTSFFVRSQGSIDPTYFYTAVANDAVTQFNWRGRTNGAGNVTITIAIYTVTLGIPDTLVGTAQTILVTSAISQVWTSSAVNIPLTPGTTYCIAWSPDVQYLGRRLAEGVNGLSQDLTIPLPATWTEFIQTTFTWTAWADVTNTPPPTTSLLFPCCAQLIS